MDKRHLLNQIRESLKAEINRLQGANKAASDSATDSEFRAETKWDTGGLEASYLARGYAQQYTQLLEQLQALANYEPAVSNGPIDLGALVKCSLNGFVSYFFLLPCAGGIELKVEGEEITTITMDSPIAQSIKGKREGDFFHLATGAKGEIQSVS